MARKEAGTAESILTTVSIWGSGTIFLSGAALAITGWNRTRLQISDGVSRGDENTPGRDADEITRTDGYDQAWARVSNWEDTYRKGDMTGTELAGQHIDGSTEFILGEVGMGLGFLVWGSAMLLRNFHR